MEGGRDGGGAVSIEGLPALEKRFAAISAGKGSRQLMGQLGLVVVAEQKRLVRRKTGNTARTIRLGRITETSVETTVNKVGRWLEFGTKAHDIVPRAKKALRWPSGSSVRLSGRAVSGSTGFAFAKRVHHPGTKPQPFMVPGAENALRKSGLKDFIVNAWNRAA